MDCFLFVTFMRNGKVKIKFFMLDTKNYKYLADFLHLDNLYNYINSFIF